MNPASAHRKHVLLVEDMEEFSKPISRWLEEGGFQVTLVCSYPEALNALDSDRYHLAILDIRLKDSDPHNEEGMQLLRRIEERQLKDVMPCIILSAYPNVDNLLAAIQWDVAYYIQKKPNYEAELLSTVRELFEDKIKINFDLIYEIGTEQLLASIADDVLWSSHSSPGSGMLTLQVHDLFGKLFFRARRLFAAKLQPGLTGAAVIRTHPTWAHGQGPSYVAKIGRRDKVEIETNRYKEFVEPYLPNSTTTQVETVYTQHLGALLYRFAESNVKPLEEFDEFYARNSVEVINKSLRNLFEDTCRYWYDTFERRFAGLPQLYYAAFELDEKKLIDRIQGELPGFDPTQPTFRLPGSNVNWVNPIAWLALHQPECVMSVYHCITHGDLTGRNIMVSERGRCWLIDFYRTHESHILRDFVILESDIKFRLMRSTTNEDFLRIERLLLAGDTMTAGTQGLSTHSVKAIEVIKTLREIAYEFLRDRTGQRLDTHREYLISLLMSTLNVVRLRHMPATKKQLAMRSASMICTELNRLAGR